ncbi:MAG: GNAT family N-acetyltransferase [Thermoplasmata archaeon]|jgi:ribosomal protein S18 acetylase RimI-like enzyme|nr:GNAT family N-acetyltransferase [Thermoplasmata archaeon]
MAPGEVGTRPTIDRAWLESEARDDPILHAYALWDLDHHPGRVRFASAVTGATTLGYLLLWPLGDGATVVHWLGDAALTAPLLQHLPPRPLIVVCSEAAGPTIERLRGPAVVHAVITQIAARGTPPPDGAHDGMVRPLTGEDRALLRTFAERQADRIGAGYTSIDLSIDPVWAGLEDGRIVALARPAVRLPHLWLIGGVYVAPAHRNQGWGRAVVRAVMAEADRAGAPCGLFVREDSAAALSLYQRLGFRPVARRLWIDAGAHRDP